MFHTIKNVLRHTLIYGFGDILAKLVGFLLIPLYTHYFSTAEYGTLELLDLSSHIISFVLAMGIAESMVRFYFDSKDQAYREQVVSVSLVATWMIASFGMLLLFPSAKMLSQIVFETPENYQLFYLVIVGIGLALCNEIPLQLFRIEQRSMLYTGISLLRLVIQLSLNIYFIVVAELGIAGILWSTVITNLLIGIALSISILRRIRLSFSFALLKDMVIYGIPLIGSWGGNFVLHFADRFILQRLGSLSSVGVYALSYKFGFLLNVFILAPFKKTWMPKQFEVVEEENAPQIFARIFTYYAFAQLFFTLGISALIEDVVRIIANEKFHDAYQYVPVLLLAYNFNGFYQILEFALLYKKRTRLLAMITLSAGLINVALNFMLIPHWGAWGATWATLIAFFCLATFTYFAAQRLYYIPIEKKRIGLLFALAFCVYAATYFIAIDSVLVSILVRGVIAASFPLLLFFVPFFSEDEKALVAELWHDRKNWKTRLGNFVYSREKALE